MTTPAHPPKPAVAIRVGVTGHRQARLEADQISRIQNQFEEILEAVSDGVFRAKEKYQQDYAHTPPFLYFVSALADGADTLAAKCAVAKNWRLLAPIPFSRQAYAEDFSAEDLHELNKLLDKADAIVELDGTRGSTGAEDSAYLQAGIVTVDQSDFVIAIWDGEEARGLAGTAMIKEEALAAGKPVVWINAVSDVPPVFLTADSPNVPFTKEAAGAAIDDVLAPPSGEELEHKFTGKDTHTLAAYRDYAAETRHTINYGSFFQFWEKLFAGKSPFSVKLFSNTPEEEIRKERQSTLADEIGASDHDRQTFQDLIIPRFVWADHLAIHYSNLYRSSYFFNYLFAALAVFLALIDLVTGGIGLGTKTMWITIEVSLILLILGVTTSGKRGRWHEKWIDYRQLAEEMRQYRLYFLTLGRDTREQDFASGEGGEAASWVDWYFTASRREAGMCSGRFGAAELRRIAETILEKEILPQISYHDRKAETLHSMEHRLHTLGEYCFGATLFVCLFYLSLAFMAAATPVSDKKNADYAHAQYAAETSETYEEAAPVKADKNKETEKTGAGEKDKAEKDAGYEKKKGLGGWAKKTKENVKGLVTLLTGFLPALGAALFGIRVQGEFGSTAERSHATAAQLKTLATKFEGITSAETPKLQALRGRVEEAARAMLMENMDWRLLYISKPLNLPG